MLRFGSSFVFSFQLANYSFHYHTLPLQQVYSMPTAIEPLKMVMNMPMNMLTMRVYADGKIPTKANHPSKCQSPARRGKQFRDISGVSFVCSSWLFGSLSVPNFKGGMVRRNTSLYGRPWPHVDSSNSSAH
jgi:hypothetical protein